MLPMGGMWRPPKNFAKELNDCKPQGGDKLEIVWTFNMQKAPYMVAPGTAITFKWKGMHNVFRMASKEAYDRCDFSGATKLGDKSPVTTIYKGRMQYFACDVYGHCGAGQKITVMSKPVDPCPKLGCNPMAGCKGVDDDGDGCNDRCECKPKCPEVMCMMFCVNGFKKHPETGCDICKCEEKPPQKSCPEGCKSYFDGCNNCRCMPDGKMA